MGDANLVTTCNFHGQEYLFKMNVVSNTLEILITDKNSGEEWQCSYDATYIENLTHKTGNFKQFEIFITMIKSGLLRTSECVTLDLLTFEDLEVLRSRKITKPCGSSNTNRRYLIVTYCVEFDKIRYPLPLEYCGPPDPVILQGTIRRLELELAKTKEDLAVKSNSSDARKIYFLQKRVDELTEENIQLHEEIRHLVKQLESKKPKCHVISLQKAVDKLEKSVASERASTHEKIQKLKSDNIVLSKHLQEVKVSERNLKARLNRTPSKSPTRLCYGDYTANPKFDTRKKSNQSLKTVYRSKSPYTDKKSGPGPNTSRPTSNRYSRIDVVKKTSSRSSSSSSAKYMDTEFQSDVPHTPYESPRPSKRGSPLVRSRSSSVASNCSFKRNPTVPITRTKNKVYDQDFVKLEKKIESLEKILRRNICNK